jgi:hypothetical protein
MFADPKKEFVELLTVHGECSTQVDQNDPVFWVKTMKKSRLFGNKWYILIVSDPYLIAFSGTKIHFVIDPYCKRI